MVDIQLAKYNQVLQYPGIWAPCASNELKTSSPSPTRTPRTKLAKCLASRWADII
jgi:hypothetical protein